jgi:hypothetical protein
MPDTTAEKVETGRRRYPVPAQQIYALLNIAHPKEEGSRAWGAIKQLGRIAERHNLQPDTLYKICRGVRRNRAVELEIEEAANVAPGTFFPVEEVGDE